MCFYVHMQITFVIFEGNKNIKKEHRLSDYRIDIPIPQIYFSTTCHLLIRRRSAAKEEKKSAIGPHCTLKFAENLIFASRTRTGIDNSISSSRYRLRWMLPTTLFIPSHSLPLNHPTSSTVKVAGLDRVCTLRMYNILEHFPTDNIAPKASDVEVKVAGGWRQPGLNATQATRPLLMDRQTQKRREFLVPPTHVLVGLARRGCAALINVVSAY